MEIVFVLAFAFPAVAQVGVVADDRHQPALVVLDAHVVNLLCIAAVASPLPCRAPGPAPGVDAGNLWPLFEGIHAPKDGMIER